MKKVATESLEEVKTPEVNPLEKTTTRVDKQTTRLECIISDPEKLEYAKMMTETLENKKAAEDTLKSFKSQMKSEIDAHIAQINMLMGKISSGKEYRPVDIEIHYDYNTRIKTFIRKDTEQVYKTESIRQDELQLHLDLEEERIIKESQKPVDNTFHAEPTEENLI